MFRVGVYTIIHRKGEMHRKLSAVYEFNSKKYANWFVDTAFWCVFVSDIRDMKLLDFYDYQANAHVYFEVKRITKKVMKREGFVFCDSVFNGQDGWHMPYGCYECIYGEFNDYTWRIDSLMKWCFLSQDYGVSSPRCSMVTCAEATRGLVV